jgi:hypothetical protein
MCDSVDVLQECGLLLRQVLPCTTPQSTSVLFELFEILKLFPPIFSLAFYFFVFFLQVQCVDRLGRESETQALRSKPESPT